MRESLKKFFIGESTHTDNGGWYFHSHSLYGGDDIQDYSGWVYACITVIANRMSGLSRHTENKKGEQTDNELSQYITPEIIQYVAISLKLYGEAYIYKIATEQGKVIGLQYINKYQIQPILANGIHTGWRVGGKVIGKDNIIVFRTANPYNHLGQWANGYSPTQASRKAMTIEWNMQEWNEALLKNGAMPGQIIYLDGEPDDAQRKRLTTMFDNEHKGTSNRGKTIYLSSSMKVEPNNMLSQKDMEFIEGMKWNMEKILATFGVPKAMLGMGEGVNVGNVEAFENIFARNVIEPLTVLIADGFTRGLLGDEKMVFDNVIPVDAVKIQTTYLYGAITRNEMRLAMGYDAVEGGDVFYDGVMAVKPEEKKTVNALSTAVTKGLRSVTKGTEEYKGKRRSDGVKRQDQFLPKLKQGLNKIFQQQEKWVLDQITDEKSLKMAMPTLDNRYTQLYLSLLMGPLGNFMENEGQIAMDEVVDGMSFTIATESIKKIQKEQIRTLAESVDSVTDDKIKKIIGQAVSSGLTPHETRQELKKVFTELTTQRLDTIVRTEATRAATNSQIQARQQSGVVTKQERYTALDERTCPHCMAMHGKVITLGDTYFKKGDTLLGTNGKPLALNYSDINGPSLHPNCRCTLLPVVE